MDRLAVQEIRRECVNFVAILDCLEEEGCLSLKEQKTLKTQIWAIKRYVTECGASTPFTTAKAW